MLTPYFVSVRQLGTKPAYFTPKPPYPLHLSSEAYFVVCLF